jgi:hypothetical protein
MSTATIDRTHQPTSQLARIWAVTKLNLANPWTAILLPWIILAVIFVANLAIWIIIRQAAGPQGAADAAEGLSYSGASLYIFVYMLVVAVQTVNLTFPFAQGYGVTRRDFYLGTVLTFVLLSAMFSIGMTILATIEEATGGWGLSGQMFTAIYFGDGPWYARLWIFFTLFLFFFFVGAIAAAIFVRWKANGVIAFFIGVGAVLIGLAALFTFTESWPAFAGFFAEMGFLGSYTWSLVLTVPAAVAGYLVLRRATPKD